MSPRVRRIATLALLAGVALPLLVGCPALLSAFIKLKICVKNYTYLDLTQFNVADAGAASWGPNDLSGTVTPGNTDAVANLAPGNYDLRAVFDDKQDCVSNDVWTAYDVPMDTENLCITFEQASSCADIYATLDYVL